MEAVGWRGTPPSRSGGGAGGGGRRSPRVIAVVVNYNGADFLGRFLDSFASLPYPNAELIVVDNASRDGSWALVAERMPGATLLRSEHNTGFTGGANRGVREALRRDADNIILLNSDTWLDAGLIEALLAEADERTMV